MPIQFAEFDSFVRERVVSPPQRLFKYMSSTTAARVLSTGRLRWSSPLTFNDPFDTQWDPLWQTCTDQFLEKYRKATIGLVLGPIQWERFTDSEYRKAVSALRIAGADLPADIRKKKAEEYAEKAVVDRIERQRKFRRDSVFAHGLRSQRVLCVAESRKSPVMWAHYGANHTGVVLEFVTAELERALRVPARRVEYLDELPQLLDEAEAIEDLLYGSENPRVRSHILHQWALGKSKDWAYEGEWRFVGAVSETAEMVTDIPYPPEALSAVWVGSRIDGEGRKRIAELVANLPSRPRLWNTEPHPFRFEVRGEGDG